MGSKPYKIKKRKKRKDPEPVIRVFSTTRGEIVIDLINPKTGEKLMTMRVDPGEWSFESQIDFINGVGGMIPTVAMHMRHKQEGIR